MAGTITLSTDLNYDTIIFDFEPHSNCSAYRYMHTVLNSHYRNLVLTGDELWNLIFHDPGTNHQELKLDALQLLKGWHLTKVFEHAQAKVASNTEGDIRSKLDLLPLLSLKADGVTKINLRTTAQLAQRFEDYIPLKGDPAEPTIFKDDSAIVIFINTSNIFHDLDSPFDGLNWSKIYDHYVPKTPAPAGAPAPSGPASTGVSPDTERMARALEAAANHSKDKKEEVFNIDGLPKEVKDRYLANTQPDTIIIKDEIKEPFKNDLTTYGGTVMPQKFVRYPNHYHSYVIQHDGTLFRYLQGQTKHTKKIDDMKKDFPTLAALTPEDFYYWHRNLEQVCFQTYMWILPYFCVYVGCKD